MKLSREGLGIPDGPGVQNPEFQGLSKAQKNMVRESGLKKAEILSLSLQEFPKYYTQQLTFHSEHFELTDCQKGNHFCQSLQPNPTDGCAFQGAKKRERNLRSQSQNNSSVEGFLKEYTKGLCFKILGEGPQRMD